MWPGKEITSDHNRRSLKCLLKSDHKKTTGELRAMFNSDRKSIFTFKICREEASLSEASLENKGYRD